MTWEVVALFIAAVIGVMLITPVLVLAYISNVVQKAVEEDEEKWKT